MEIKIGLADDHHLFRTGIATLINGEQDFNVIIEAKDGEDFLKKINVVGEPDIAIVDIKMKGMNGFELTEKLSEFYPKIKVIALSMFMDEISIIKMVNNGAKSYLLKGSEPWELHQAIRSTYHTGFYNGPVVSNAIRNQMNNKSESYKKYEIEFIKLCCSELTYKEIAEKMYVSPRTIDGYRDRIFTRFEVKNRVGLVLFAIKNKIHSLD